MMTTFTRLTPIVWVSIYILGLASGSDRITSSSSIVVSAASTADPTPTGEQEEAADRELRPLSSLFANTEQGRSSNSQNMFGNSGSIGSVRYNAARRSNNNNNNNPRPRPPQSRLPVPPKPPQPPTRNRPHGGGNPRPRSRERGGFGGSLRANPAATVQVIPNPIFVQERDIYVVGVNGQQVRDDDFPSQDDFPVEEDGVLSNAQENNLDGSNEVIVVTDGAAVEAFPVINVNPQGNIIQPQPYYGGRGGRGRGKGRGRGRGRGKGRGQGRGPVITGPTYSFGNYERIGYVDGKPIVIIKDRDIATLPPTEFLIDDNPVGNDDDFDTALGFPRTESPTVSIGYEGNTSMLLLHSSFLYIIHKIVTQQNYDCPSFFVSFFLPPILPSYMQRQPTQSPTPIPTREPTKQPTKQPTKEPTKRPTKSPTKRPTKQPTKSPTKRPSRSPTQRPSRRPTVRTSVF